MPTPAAKMTERDDRMVIRVTRIEKRKFERLARSLNTDLSEAVRQILHREADQYILAATKTLRTSS